MGGRRVRARWCVRAQGEAGTARERGGGGGSRRARANRKRRTRRSRVTARRVFRSFTPRLSPPPSPRHTRHARSRSSLRHETSCRSGRQRPPPPPSSPLSTTTDSAVLLCRAPVAARRAGVALRAGDRCVDWERRGRWREGFGGRNSPRPPPAWGRSTQKRALRPVHCLGPAFKHASSMHTFKLCCWTASEGVNKARGAPHASRLFSLTRAPSALFTNPPSSRPPFCPSPFFPQLPRRRAATQSSRRRRRRLSSHLPLFLPPSPAPPPRWPRRPC